MFHCGDAKVIDSLYREMGPAVLSKISYLVRDRRLAEDVVQEVFLQIWRTGQVFDSRRHAYRVLYRSCHNRGVDHLRRIARRREENFDETFFPDFRTTEAMPFQSDHDHFWDLITSLPQKDAEILCYRFVDDMTQEEIAEVTELSRKTIQRSLEKSLARVRLRLRK